MLYRRFQLVSSVCWAALLAGLASPLWADYGVSTKRPLSSPRDAKIDESVAGTWRTVIRGKTYYLHIGTGNIVGKFDWMELVLVNPGDKKPTFYVYRFVGYPSSVGGERYFNVALLSKLIPQIRGSKVEDLLSAVDRYEIMQYRLQGDYLDIWSADQKLVRAAIKEGKIKGNQACIDDTPENVARFIESTPNLFPNKFRYTRVKDPAPPAADRGKTAEKAPAPANPVRDS